MSRTEFSLTKSARLGLVLSSLVAGAGLSYYLSDFYYDDAFIALRYSENLVSGHGVVWNPDERVEGFTSLLWVLMCAALHFAGIDLMVASRLLGVLSLLGLCTVVIHFQRQGGLPVLLL